jgi:glycosyltransferase involved in cell wall biosynthesis
VILGIDASNLRGGGGVTHLVRLLEAARPADHGFERVRVWGGRATLDQIAPQPWLDRIHVPALDGSLLARLGWQLRELPGLAREAAILFAPGGTTPRGVSPVVTMSQNLLPFDPPERGRYGFSRVGVRLRILRFAQAGAFRRAQGVIFLTPYAERRVLESVSVPGRRSVIPHGIDERFRRDPAAQEPLAAFSEARPFRLVYVSIIDLYKHQWHVARAAAALRREGVPIDVTFVGPAYPPALARFRAVLDEEDPAGRFLHYVGPIPNERLHEAYRDANGVLFASSCETIAIILLEAMASGLPVAVAERGPIPEVVGDGGVYFDPESPDSIAAALRRLLADPELRAACAARAHERARAYTWRRCADETFAFLAEIARER